MPQRRLSDKQRRWLQAELTDWIARGVISDEQSRGILASYESVEDIGRRKRSLFVFAIMGIAALLVGLAALLVVSHNWNAIPGPVKLVNMLVLITATHSAAFYLRYKRNVGRWSELVYLLGCLLFGGGIWLVGQVFHLDAHWPDAIWWWAIGVLPFALGLDTILLHCLLVGLLALWAGVEVLGFTHLGPWLFWGWGMLPNGAYSLPLLAVPGFLWAYRKGSAATLGLYVPLLGWWVVLQAFAWRFEFQAVFLIGCVGAVLLIMAENHRHGSLLAIPYRIYGVLLVAGSLVPLSFADFCKEVGYEWNWLSGRPFLYVASECIAIMVLIAATLAACVVARAGRAGESNSPVQRLIGLVRDQWVPAGLAAVMAFLAVWSLTVGDSAGAWLVPTVLANAAMIVLAVWLMRLGLRDDRGRPFAGGVLYFLLWSVLRYFDLFGREGGMLGAALMFFLCGAAMFGLAMFWRARKEARHV